MSPRTKERKYGDFQSREKKIYSFFRHFFVISAPKVGLSKYTL